MDDKDIKAVLTVRMQPLSDTIATKYVLPFKSVEDAWEELKRWMAPETIYIELRDMATGMTYSWSGWPRQ